MNNQDKETLVYIIIIVLLIFSWFKFNKPQIDKYQKNLKKVARLKPEIKKLRKKAAHNKTKLAAKKAKESKKATKHKKKFVISKLTNAQDNTSIILDEIFMLAKSNNIQLLEIDHSANDSAIAASSNRQRRSESSGFLSKINKAAESLSTDLSQKEIEYYKIKFLFSSDYDSMKNFLNDLLQINHYIRIDSVESKIQKGRSSIINTKLNISILLKKD